MRALYTAFPDSVHGAVWLYRREQVPAGLAAFGKVAGVYVVITGHVAGLVAMDWLREHGIDPVAA